MVVFPSTAHCAKKLTEHTERTRWIGFNTHEEKGNSTGVGGGEVE